jgi:hypothetical protein
MAFEYVVQYPCKVKDEITVEGLVRQVKLRAAAEGVQAKMQAAGETQPASEVRITRMVLTPDGKQEEAEVTLQALLEETSGLSAYEPLCQGCPACVGGGPFGCYQAINYPIEAQTEKWLLARLPADLDSSAGRLLRKLVADLQCDGAAVAALRNSPAHMESRRSETRAWGGFLSKWRLTSDQLLEMILAHEGLEPLQCALLCLVLGTLPPDTPPEVFRDAKQRRAVLAEAVVSVSDVSEQIGAAGRYLEALRRCAAIEVPLWASF